ncbi:amidohydrolase family protein [Zunongwangia sp. SCSIO 43204]|uniref:amidohydrolase family protein n=1 Tax=Zunongwangia sp. SCSIO 43204 TaxID=2779359 RepID=UPI001CA95D9F|nr:amidohydrolase family protein [Zunongwangia sp. SCSIO 43204]UAB82779.1 amidohydrolase family protein [Zunongwangia sp. SCSIO 43204]
MKYKFLLCFLFLGITSLSAQEYFPTNSGVKTTNTNYTVFKNATIHVDPTSTIENGMFAIKNGKITAVGKSISTPKNSVIIDLEGKDVYPSFIDLYSEFGIKKPEREAGFGRSGQYEATREGFYWNDHIRPEQNAVESFSYDAREAGKYHNGGFGVVNTHIADGIMRGSGVLIALNPNGTEGDRILKDRSAQYLSFDKSVKSPQSYPSSTMGVMALIRQAYLDAKWYANGHADNKDLALEALNRNKNLTQIFATDNLLNELRVDKVGDEFGVQYVILGSGFEYEKLDQIKETEATYLVPLTFPAAYDVEDGFMAEYVSLADMKRWNQAPANLKMLADADVPFTITTKGLDPAKEFKENLLKAIEYGLSKEDALAALTTTPAKVIGQAGKIGEIKEGAWANFIITSGDFFEKDSKIFENWVQGEKAVINTMNTTDITGKYDLELNGKEYTLNITGSPERPKAKIEAEDVKVGSKLSFEDSWMNLLVSSPDTTKTEFIRLTAKVASASDKISGKAILPNGDTTSFTATKHSSEEKSEDSEDKKEDETSNPEVVPVTFPNAAYGFEEIPEAENILFKNATVWTNEEQGIMENADVLVKKGKIAKIGKDLKAGGATVIDATGKHLTSGIVDEHSHIALSSVNEGGHNSSAEVTMEDVIDPTDVALYRDLAGGVTTAQLLHGSANPIGGKSAIVRLKWGSSAEDMIFPESPKFIKFALGENVKQSNWGSGNRFPVTRMGVEQVFMDYFGRAKEYMKNKEANPDSYRKDIEMETLAEILRDERNITSHSYVQSEINMLMHVADSMDFRINTFTHILEGYKLADKMAERNIGGATFSDWWAYKYEVEDAIPYNAAIMHSQGVVTAINSDDAEMSRRLNQEAGKTMKYGGLTEEEAWKLVTLNPAKLLHIDDKVGSIKEGKDADLVLWSDHPLSVYAKAEKTLIEGVVYFDIDRDKELRESIKKQKSELITQMLQAKNKGVKTQPVVKKDKVEAHCNTMGVIR